jgi:hypothetical protein
MAHPTRIMYVERKNRNDDGPAWIGRVQYSKTGRTVYYRDWVLRRVPGKTWDGGNYVDVAAGDSYWVSGFHKDGLDRHPAARHRAPVEIDADVLDEYLAAVEPDVAARPRQAGVR